MYFDLCKYFLCLGTDLWSRFQELREEVHILDETRTMLEEQLATSRRRVETVIELENKLMKYHQQIEELNTVGFYLH